MTIAVPTDDRITLAKRTGQASYFAFYRVKDGRYDQAFFRENPQKHEHHHHGKDEHHHSHPEILELLKEVNVVLVLNIGKFMKADLESNGIRYEKIRETSLEKAVENFLNTK
jgi:predicted Fe-Mo cluster-binding NifX family protein